LKKTLSPLKEIGESGFWGLALKPDFQGFGARLGIAIKKIIILTI